MALAARAKELAGLLDSLTLSEDKNQLANAVTTSSTSNGVTASTPPKPEALILITTSEKDDEAVAAPETEPATEEEDTDVVIYKKYGKFKCPKCTHKWTSAHSWRDKGQVCLNCSTEYNDTYVLPYDLITRAVQTNNGRRGIPHQKSLCQMCQSLKKNCAKINAVKVQKKSKAKKTGGAATQ